MTNQQPPNHPYAAPPNQPYAQQQPNQPYAPQQQPHPYAAQQPGPYQQQYAQHPYQQQAAHPHPQTQQQPQPQRSVPEEVGDYRRWFAALIDGSIAFFGGFALAKQLAEGESVGTFWGYLVGLVLGISFVHHVFGTLIFRTTVGKFICTTRVVRAEDGGRPRFWQIVGRWLMGLTWLPMQPIRSLIAAEGDPYEDHCGLRYVRSADLR